MVIERKEKGVTMVATRSLFHFVWLTVVVLRLEGHYAIPEKHVPLFVFGDSAFDPGNNNYIMTSTSGKANYYPYGETFFKFPTGRFSDGRIIPDFIAEYMKLPLIPPYLQPNREIKYGVNFASAGGGALVESNQGMTIDLHTQLKYFKNVSLELKNLLGDSKAKALLSKAIYMFSVGSNDYVYPFTINPTVLRTYSREEFIGLVMGNITSLIQEIYQIGGRKFAFTNIWPLACVPFLRVIRTDQIGACFDAITPYVQLHNSEISKLLPRLRNTLKGIKYSLIDSHSFVQKRMNNPRKYGFKEGQEACCGSGPYRGVLSCGGKGSVTEYFLCEDPKQYLFFDSHLTEKAYQQLAIEAWNGHSLAKPYNLKTLFCVD